MRPVLVLLLPLVFASAAVPASSAPVPVWASKGEIAYKCGNDALCRVAGAAGLEGLLAGEHVPSGDQDLAGDGALGRVGLAAALLDVAVELVPGVERFRLRA
jgi:hypothetical protein